MRRFSSTESDGNSRRPSGTSAMPRATTAWAGSFPIGSPSNRMASRRDAMTPAMHLSSVDLPAPLAPMTATTSPGGTRSETPNSAWKSPQNASSARASRSGSGIGGNSHIDVAHGGRRDHRLRGALADEAAAVQNNQTIDQRDERVNDVLDPDDRDAAAANVADQVDQRRAFVLGQAAGDLVEQEHARLRGECARELEPLAVEQREAAGGPIRLGREAALLDELDAAPIDVALAAAAAERRRHDQVLEHGHAVERLRNLKRAADAQATAPFRRQMGDVDAREDDAPGIGRNRAAGDAEQRGLAGAVRPDDAERLALGEREVERARDHHGAEALGDFFEGENGRHAVVVRVTRSTLACKRLSTAHSRDSGNKGRGLGARFRGDE